MTHPRLSVSAMCTHPWTFAEDLALWDELEVRNAGLILQKLEDHGLPDALAALRRRGIAGTSVITHNFDLAAPETWDTTRAFVNRAIDVAAEIGGVPYFTPGAGDGRSTDELAVVLAQAVEPCLAYAEARGVRIAIEPTLRVDRSFVNTLAGGITVARRAGIGVITDLGNCWREPDLHGVIRSAGGDIAVVQIADAVPGTLGRAVPGDGELDLAAFVRAALDTGYPGAVEIEIVGPRVDEEGHSSATRRAVERTHKLLQEVVG
ncbi:sugar phosphate isomerase/epimerase [Yinghuangia sp. ASG 101]|uniref:sugar phosphate isomerase/epimerase family protein n=1 Tax=Yinghuangia sp. ASG 101 TaxID=2896848 RepID=UPI001E475C4E|nr:sugar phosphate isomerase/epimerase [Yinghuangia sp. ASG 101]UGQ13363.1 sugar phosphate isomerase/epimerase [Yinghuangia sp. ASG 101]